MSSSAVFSIRYSSSNGPTMMVQLGDRDFVVGSAENADIRIQSSTISRQHARFALRDGRVYVTDLNSRNGTFLNGQRLPANLDYEWQPGDSLRLTDTQFELVRPQTASQPAGEVLLDADPTTITPAESVQLSVRLNGMRAEQVSLQGYGLLPGVEVLVQPNSVMLQPGAPLEAVAQVRQTQRFVFGKLMRVRFAASTVSGLFSTKEIVVRLRPRYELLLLLLPFFLGCGLAAFLALRPQEQPLATSTFPPPPTAAPQVSTALPTSTPVPTTAATATPTLTPTIPGCQIECAGWTTYTVQSGDTLGILAAASGTTIDEIARRNCIADVNVISSGQRICLPFIPPTVDAAVSVAVTGQRDIGSPYPLFAEYTVTVSNAGASTVFGRVRVTSTSTGSIIGSAGGSGWTCSVIGISAIDCTHPGPIRPGASLPGIVVAHNYATTFTVLLSAPRDGNLANNSASGFACTGVRCAQQEEWRRNCAANRDSDRMHTPEASDACEQWQALGL
ncbi:MAG: FHA domain-containing protein [Anaerolineae bacterium]|nr:FHA domain-containing protein [Anaerolineae bacterium]